MKPARLDRTMICAGGLALALIHSMADAAAIYRCERAGTATYSDRPCAPDAAVHQSDGSRVSVYDGQPISKRASQPRPNAKRSLHPASVQKSAAARAKRQASCAKLDQSLREVRTKLRTGYGIKEGERLKARQRQLAERRRTEKCR